MDQPASGEDRWPVVSAVVATHDRPELLRAALQAIRAQRYAGRIETIVVFDGSDPDQSLVRDDPERPVRVLPNTRTRGLAGARNTGILEAEGSLVAFCDDDDAWHPEKTTAQVIRLQREPDAVAVATGMTIDYDGREIVRVWPHTHITLAHLTRSRVQDAHPSSLLLRRDALMGAVGLVDETLPGSYGEDHDLLIRAARVQPIEVVREPLVDVLWHRASHFSGKWQTAIDAIDHLIDKHEELRADPRGLSFLRGRQAFAHAALGQRREARRVALQSLRLHPWDRRAMVSLVVSTGVVSVPQAQRIANALGRGI